MTVEAGHEDAAAASPFLRDPAALGPRVRRAADGPGLRDALAVALGLRPAVVASHLARYGVVTATRDGVVWRGAARPRDRWAHPSPRALWEALEARGLIPAGWAGLDDGAACARRFASGAAVATRVAVRAGRVTRVRVRAGAPPPRARRGEDLDAAPEFLPWPSRHADAVALAADPRAVLTAEALGREAWARFALWDLPPAESTPARAAAALREDPRAVRWTVVDRGRGWIPEARYALDPAIAWWLQRDPYLAAWRARRGDWPRTGADRLAVRLASEDVRAALGHLRDHAAWRAAARADPTRFAHLPDPFAALLDLWATGMAPERPGRGPVALLAPSIVAPP